MSKTDVNAGFDAERADMMADIARQAETWNQRVSDGTARYLGGGRYQIIGGYDNGEVWSVTNKGLMPEHGLDMLEDGKAALYTRVPEWHNLGQIVPAGLTDIKEILRLCGGDYHVSKRASYFVDEGLARRADDFFMTVRDDISAALGQVGDIYTPFQNYQAYDFMIELLASGALIAETAGVMKGGRKFFISTRLPEQLVVDADGINDEIVFFVIATVRHDGKGSNLVLISPWRPRCRNTERLAVTGAVAKWGFRHTKNIDERVAEARETLRLTDRYAARFVEDETILARTNLAIDEFNEVIADLWPLDDDAKDAEKRNWTARRDLLIHNYREDPANANCAGTFYAGERSVTDLLDNLQTRKPRASGLPNMSAARATAVLEGTDDTLKDKTHRLLMARAVRRR